MTHYAINVTVRPSLFGVRISHDGINLIDFLTPPPWAGRYFYQAEIDKIALPETLYIIAVDKFKADFDSNYIVNSNFLKFGDHSYVCSEFFFSILFELNITYKSCPVIFCDERGNIIFNKNYYLVLFCDLVKSINFEKSMYNEFEKPVFNNVLSWSNTPNFESMSHIMLRSDIDIDIFTPIDVPAVALFCSERVKLLCEENGINDMEFVALDNVIITGNPPGDEVRRLFVRPPSRDEAMQKAMERRRKKQK